MISVRADAPKDLEYHKKTIGILMEAINEDVKIKMQYYSVHSQQKKTYTIHPYRLMYFRGGMYLFALVEEYKQIRTFAIERIESIEKTREPFEKPKDFSVESYLESAFGVVKEDPFDVEIVFNTDIAEYVRSRVWHPSQQVREIGGGRINMKMHVGGEFELGSWILSFGSSATVVSPDRLRRRRLVGGAGPSNPRSVRSCRYRTASGRSARRCRRSRPRPRARPRRSLEGWQRSP